MRGSPMARRGTPEGQAWKRLNADDSRVRRARRSAPCGRDRLLLAVLEHLHRDVRREQVLEPLLEVPLDELVERAPPARPEQHLLDPPEGGEFRDLLGRVLARVV